MKARNINFRWLRVSKLWLISLALHLLVVGALFQFGLLRVDLSLNRQQARIQAEKVARRSEVHREHQQRKRAKRKLSKEHARKLKREVERLQQQRLRQYVASIRDKFDRLRSLKQEKLSEISRRTADDYRRQLLEELDSQAETLARETGALSRRYRHSERSALAELAQTARESTRQLQEAPDDAALMQKLAQQAKQTLDTAQSNVTSQDPGHEGEMRLGLPEDVQNHQLAAQFQQLVDRLIGGAPDMNRLNDTRNAKPHDEDLPAEVDSMTSVDELYETARQLEQVINDHYRDLRAAELALLLNTSFDEAMQQLAGLSTPERPSLTQTLSDHGQRLSADEAGTIGQLNDYRDALRQAIGQAHSIDLRAGTLLGQIASLEGEGSSRIRAVLAHGAHQAQGNSADLSLAMRALAGVSTSGAGSGASPNRRFHRELEGGAEMAHVDQLPGIHIPSQKVFAQAIPGRRFSRASSRQGWLYLDTWYLIGPWENQGRVDYTKVHPPEFGVDFDAVYSDGKEGRLLSWQYFQSNNIRVIPPDAPGDSTWYAYTELYFDEPMDMLLAVASDDATKVWINDQVVWQENGLSQWRIGEGARKVFFRQGTNTILTRVENGPGETIFSVVICPEQAAPQR